MNKGLLIIAGLLSVGLFTPGKVLATGSQEDVGSVDPTREKGIQHKKKTVEKALCDGKSYTGEVDEKESMPDGEGTIISYLKSTGELERYTGDFKEGMIDGKGKATYYDQGKYEGEFRNGLRDGNGKMIFKGGQFDRILIAYNFSYDGEWSNDKITGKGKFEYSAKDGIGVEYIEYEGQLVDGKRYGRGTMRWQYGGVYDGEWLDGERSGRGVMRWQNGTVYDGDWLYNRQSGHGTMRWLDGSVYDGKWLDGKRSGRGVMRWQNGTVYDGDWLYNKQSGHGVMTWQSGNVYDGDWLYGGRSGYGTMTYGKESHFNFVADSCIPGGTYDGEWQHDKKSGIGRMRYDNGEVYIGQWKDSRHGCGIITHPPSNKYPNGRICVGKFESDKLIEDTLNDITNPDEIGMVNELVIAVKVNSEQVRIVLGTLGYELQKSDNSLLPSLKDDTLPIFEGGGTISKTISPLKGNAISSLGYYGKSPLESDNHAAATPKWWTQHIAIDPKKVEIKRPIAKIALDYSQDPDFVPHGNLDGSQDPDFVPHANLDRPQGPNFVQHDNLDDSEDSEDSDFVPDDDSEDSEDSEDSDFE